MSYTLDEYARMLVDPVRAAAYFAAVREVVRPGSVVADIGAGPGVLGVYAATLGARRVFLVDPDLSVQAGAALAEENGVGDRVEIIRQASTDIELPERADVIVSDLRGVTPFHGQHFAAAADMRQRLLAPGGRCIPLRDHVMVALAEDDALYHRTVLAWNGMPVPLAHASLDGLLANRWYHARATGDQLLSEPMPFVTLEYDRAIPVLSGTWESEATRDGTVHGLLLWFDTELTPTIGFSNAPSAPAALYGQALFPFSPAPVARRGQKFQITLRAVPSGDDYAWHWSVTDDGGRAITHASLFGIPLHGGALARRADAFVPRRTNDADVLSWLLQAADGTRSLGALAAGLRSQFPDRFPTEASALDFVSQHDYLWQR